MTEMRIAGSLMKSLTKQGI